MPSRRSCVGGRECALEKGEVIQHDRDGSTALGSLELLMRPPSSLPSARLSTSEARSLFLSLLPAIQQTFFLLGLCPPLRPFRFYVRVARLRDERRGHSNRGNGRIFIPTRRRTNSRNVIAQLRGLVLLQRPPFLSCPSAPSRQLATAKRAFRRFSTTNERESDHETKPRF